MMTASSFLAEKNMMWTPGATYHTVALYSSPYLYTVVTTGHINLTRYAQEILLNEWPSFTKIRILPNIGICLTS